MTINPKDAPKATEDDDEDDLFGSDDDEEDAEAAKQREANLAAYKKKKEGKTKPAAKSIVTLDVKPWGISASLSAALPTLTTHVDDETDMKELEKNLRAVEMDGLVWGASKLVPLAFGIKKLQVNLVVEDEKVSIDDLQAKIEEDEDHVQSTDVVSHTVCCATPPTVLTPMFCSLLCKSCRLHYSIGHLVAAPKLQSYTILYMILTPMVTKWANRMLDLVVQRKLIYHC